MNRSDSWSERMVRRVGFGNPVDPEMVKVSVIDALMEHGALRTEQLVRDLKGRCSEASIRQCLRFLKEQGFVQREGNKDPWTLKR